MQFTQEIKEALHSSDLFKNLDKDNENEIFNLLNCDEKVFVKQLEPNGNVFHMSENAGKIGIVLKGRIQVEKLLPNGETISIAFKTKGSMIGEAAVFSKAGIYPCELNAKEVTQILFIPKDILLRILQKDSVLLENFLTELSTMTFVLQSKVELLSYSGITEKISYFLLSRYWQTGNLQFQIPDSITSFASFLHVSRPSLHRELAKLQKKGGIKISGKIIQITDVQKLEAELSR